MTLTAENMRWRNKAVRDLEWVMQSPSTLKDKDCDNCPFLLPDELCRSILNHSSTATWLSELDENPEQLNTLLNYSRLGLYSGSLLEYWFRHCPVFATFECLSRVAVGAPRPSRKLNQQGSKVGRVP